MPAIRSVLGEIPASALGATNGHEHLVENPARAFAFADPSEARTTVGRNFKDTPVSRE